jgi:hypothetical protein
MKFALLLALSTALPFAAGCVKSYQREYLSLRSMTPEAEALDDHFRQHWQESREGSSGGYAGAGGGCGCN